MSDSDLPVVRTDWRLCDRADVPHYLNYHPVVEMDDGTHRIVSIQDCINPRLWKDEYERKGAPRVATNFGRLRDYGDSST